MAITPPRIAELRRHAEKIQPGKETDYSQERERMRQYLEIVQRGIAERVLFTMKPQEGAILEPEGVIEAEVLEVK